MEKVPKAIKFLEEAVSLASSELAGEQWAARGTETLVNILVARVLDGTAVCYALLCSDNYTFVPVILRSMVEALAQIKSINADDYNLDAMILVNNEKRIKLMEGALRSKALSEDHRVVAIESIRKAKKENSVKNRGDVNVSKLIDGLNNDVLQHIYTLCAQHSHNDLNEMVSLYRHDGVDYVRIGRVPSEGYTIPIWVNMIIIVLFNLVRLYYERYKIEPSKRLLLLGNLAAVRLQDMAD